MNKVSFFAVPALVLLMLSSCYYDVEEELFPENKGCDTTAVSYAQAVKPILDSKCTGCHGGGAPSAGIKIDTYIDLKGYLDIDAARFVSSIVHDGNASNMPKGQSKMPDCDVNKIRAWINAGYPEN